MHIYFSGIGGVGLGPLAEISHDGGYDVSGSDRDATPTFLKLQKEGFELSLDQSGKYIAEVHTHTPIDWFVYTAALPAAHPELAFAKTHGIKTTKRDELLKEIVAQKKLKLIAVSGTHGKTTTTAMLVWLFKQLGVPVSYLVGAPMSWASSGAFDPASKYFIYECDEYDRNFLQFHPYLSLITSQSYDHSDTYPDKSSYDEAFAQFKAQSEQVFSTGEVNPNLITLPGEHNRRNGALAARAASTISGQPKEKIAALLEGFPGTSRRFEKLANNIYSDYAHHPEEIAATLELAGELSEHVVAVYQPHQNIRQHYVAYNDCFGQAEKVYWVPTYLSREDPDLEILTPRQLTKNIAPEKIVFAELDDTLWHNIVSEQQAGKLVILMGAGSIDGWAQRQLS